MSPDINKKLGYRFITKSKLPATFKNYANEAALLKQKITLGGNKSITESLSSVI